MRSTSTPYLCPACILNGVTTATPGVQRQADFSNAHAELGTDVRRRLALASYYALVSFLDEQVGVVLRALADSGQETSTRVIFTSDHGDNQGARGMWNKSTLISRSNQHTTDPPRTRRAARPRVHDKLRFGGRCTDGPVRDRPAPNGRLARGVH